MTPHLMPLGFLSARPGTHSGRRQRPEWPDLHEDEFTMTPNLMPPRYTRASWDAYRYDDSVLSGPALAGDVADKLGVRSGAGAAGGLNMAPHLTSRIANARPETRSRVPLGVRQEAHDAGRGGDDEVHVRRSRRRVHARRSPDADHAPGAFASTVSVSI